MELSPARGFTVLEDAGQVAERAAYEVAASLAAGARSLVLAGGSTPRLTYERLARMPVAWGRVVVLFGDERCVAPGDPESNYAAARSSLLDHVFPAGVLRIPAELGAEEAAREYSRLVEGVGSLDLVLLGIGEDGHCASLFPGHAELAAPGLVTAVHGAPKPPPDRVSLTLTALKSARRVLFLVTGQDKAWALRQAQEGLVPAGLIPGAQYLCDRASASSL